MRLLTRYGKRHAAILIVLLGCASVVAAAAHQYLTAAQGLSDEILAQASQLQAVSHDPIRNSVRIEGIIAEMKGLIEEYEENLVLAQSRYPGEILLGRTPAGHSTWLETLCEGRYRGMLKEIRIRRVGRWPSYIRINDIEITYSTPGGMVKETLNRGGAVKLHRDRVFAIALPRPMKIERIRINIGHASSGLEVYGIPYELNRGRLHPRPTQPVRPEPRPGPQTEPCPEKMLLGTTPPGHSTWVETLCKSHCGGPVREVRLKRTGRKASYLRINDIEITYMTPRGLQKKVLNEGARVKLYYGGEFRLALPQPMRIVRIRIKIDHESTGLEVYGVI